MGKKKEGKLENAQRKERKEQFYISVAPHKRITSSCCRSQRRATEVDACWKIGCGCGVVRRVHGSSMVKKNLLCCSHLLSTDQVASSSLAEVWNPPSNASGQHPSPPNHSTASLWWPQWFSFPQRVQALFFILFLFPFFSFPPKCHCALGLSAQWDVGKRTILVLSR